MIRMRSMANYGGGVGARVPHIISNALAFPPPPHNKYNKGKKKSCIHMPPTTIQGLPVPTPLKIPTYATYTDAMRSLPGIFRKVA